MGGLFIYSFLEPIILFYQMDAGMSCNILNWLISSESLTFICPDWQKFAALEQRKVILMQGPMIEQCML